VFKCKKMRMGKMKTKSNSIMIRYCRVKNKDMDTIKRILSTNKSRTLWLYQAIKLCKMDVEDTCNKIYANCKNELLTRN